MDYLPNQQIPYETSTLVPQNSNMAIVSLVCGLLGWNILPLVGAIIAIITGHLAIGEIGRSGGRLTGKSLATIGLVLGYIELALWIIGICCVLAIFVVPFLTFLFGDSLMNTMSGA
jgi:hypothetical protein